MTFRLSVSSVLRRTFPDEMSFRLHCTSPEGSGSGFRSFGAEALHFLRPCDPSNSLAHRRHATA
jgi:hypothetical protein